MVILFCVHAVLMYDFKKNEFPLFKFYQKFHKDFVSILCTWVSSFIYDNDAMKHDKLCRPNMCIWAGYKMSNYKDYTVLTKTI